MGDVKKDRPVVGRGNSAGRVEVDSRGRNVWQWNDARIDIDSTTILLKRLDNDALELEPTQSVPIPKRPKTASGARDGAQRPPDTKRSAQRPPRGVEQEWVLSESMRMDMGGGFDPYNRT